MDPYEQPSYAEISERCLEQWGNSDFGELFLEEMCLKWRALPLDDMCEGGSYPDPRDIVECDNLVIDYEENGIVVGHFGVSFTQLSPTGCRDMQWRAHISGRIDFSLNLANGEIGFEPPTVTREYEPGEF